MLCDECRRATARTDHSLTTRQQRLLVLLFAAACLVVFLLGLALTPVFTN